MGDQSDNQDLSLLATTPESPANATPNTTSGSYSGLLLKDRYLIEREIGRGGIGRVYLARDRQLLSRPVVIKVLMTDGDNQAFAEWFHKKFRQEMEALVRINHPGVVGVLDSGEMPDGKPFLVMQYVEGATLRSLISPDGMEFARVARITRQMGQALAAAHGKGVCHRDLKPENVMLEQPGRDQEQVKLIDFGVARVDDSQVATSAEQTWVAGTPPYMAPEQLRGHPTFRSDIYSFGALAYEMLTGRMPFKAITTVDLYELQRSGEFPPPGQLRRDLPDAAQTAILRALSFRAEDRHPSALAFSEELARALDAAPAASATTAPAPIDRVTRIIQSETTADAPAPNSARLGPRRVAMLAVLLTALAAAIGWFAWNRPGTPVQSPPAVLSNPAERALAERALDYWVVVQKYRNQKPYREPFALAGNSFLFDDGDRIFLHLAVAQSGHFYLLNEGPQPVRDLPAYVVLFPAPGVNGGSARLEAGQTLRFPEQGKGYEFKLDRGAEKLWLICSEAGVPELEAVKSAVNPTQQGSITDAAQIRAVRDYLTNTQAASPASAQENKEKRQTRVTARGGALLHRIEFQHY
jgi:serine/threonine protein kinase